MSNESKGIEWMRECVLLSFYVLSDWEIVCCNAIEYEAERGCIEWMRERVSNESEGAEWECVWECSDWYNELNERVSELIEFNELWS